MTWTITASSLFASVWGALHHAWEVSEDGWSLPLNLILATIAVLSYHMGKERSCIPRSVSRKRQISLQTAIERLGERQINIREGNTCVPKLTSSIYYLLY